MASLVPQVWKNDNFGPWDFKFWKIASMVLGLIKVGKSGPYNNFWRVTIQVPYLWWNYIFGPCCLL